VRPERIHLLCLLGLFCTLPCRADVVDKIEDIADLAPGWTGEVISKVDQSYVGWDVEIGDADNDGKNEVLATGCPDSRLYLFKKDAGRWQTHLLAENLARRKPGMGLAVKVVDLNKDGRSEIILGTGQEAADTAWFYVFQTDGRRITKRLSCQPTWCNKSAYTHDLAPYDLNGDGILEVISAYCGGGEIVRYDFDKDLTEIGARKIYNLSGSGEDSLIADVDNDGRVEYVTSNSFRAGKARVEVFNFDAKGELVTPPRIVVDGFDGHGCFYASVVIGDLDNDGKNEMVVGWKREQKINKATLIAYRVAAKAEPVYRIENETEDLDMAYFEKMMAITDADNDGKNELIVSTRGDNVSEFITSKHLGHVFMYKVVAPNRVEKQRLVKFNENQAESSWPAVGDADNDGRNEIVLATGKGDRTKAGVSYVVLIKRR
jgi:hypothetical protein